MLEPPVAPRSRTERVVHGESLVDDYAWMADRDDPRLLAYLEAENAYADARTAHLAPLVESLVAEISGRTQQTDLAVPVRHDRWWYYTRTMQGASYPVDARVLVADHPQRPALDDGSPPPGEEILLDHNLAAAGHHFFALGALEVSPDGARLGYAVDVVGDERHDLTILDLATREVLDDAVRGIGDGLAWSADGRHVFYTRLDETFRSHQVWRHEVGTEAGEDVLVLEEPDPRFWVSLGVSRDERVLVIVLAARTSTEVHLVAADRPGDPPHCVAPRRPDLEYLVEPVDGGCFVVHNAHRRDFDLAWAPAGSTGEADWHPLDVVGPDEYLTDVEAFDAFLVLALRRGGSTRLRVLPRSGGPAAAPDRPEAAAGSLGPGHEIELGPPLASLATGANPWPGATSLQVTCQSGTTPPRVYDYDPVSREATLVKQVVVPSGHDPDSYVERREWARAADGTAVPMTLLHRRDVVADGTPPGLLYGYGAYGICLDPHFSVATLSLLDRGLVVAVAHVRGGSELGRHWYDGGRVAEKTRSMSDFLACADRLVETRWVAPDRLAAQGGSAGGLLVGAAANMAPEKFRAVHAQVPFVDVLSSMLDEDLPLTTLETQEWGDPLRDTSAYQVIRDYCPYRNVSVQAYPSMLVTANLHDTRVLVTEPAKWVARLRECATNDPERAPILLRTEFGAGHSGRSGRYAAWREAAWEMAVLLDWLDAAD